MKTPPAPAILPAGLHVHTHGEPFPHLRRDSTGRTELIVDGRPLKLIGGEFHNSASSCLRHAECVFDTYRDLGCNAALVPISWELLEPQEGRFDVGLVDGLLDLARSRGIRLVPLWFGTYKNAQSTYAPAWVKTDQQRFPRAHTSPGVPAGAVCVLSDEARRHDALCYTPFGLESMVWRQAPHIAGNVATGSRQSECADKPVDLLRGTYRVLQGLLPEMNDCLGAGRSAGILQDDRGVQSFTIGGYTVTVSFTAPFDRRQPAAGGIIASPADGEFIVAGFGFRADFLEISESHYTGDRWISGRRLNGDEYNVRCGQTPCVLSVKVYNY